ncbi:hypothetical protein PLICRDRAFT_37800 [Plicaturopsis crispa FD-325 SS-3]|nr:hypothetical protein PLICRDRAFT_37800 [Plicaturopsis crispa FD-325 SS-3]
MSVAPATNLSDALAALQSKRTLANAFQAWLLNSEATLSETDFKSAKNFARAFRIWFDKSQKPRTCEEDEESIRPYNFHTALEFFADNFQLESDPILDHLDPTSKTTRVAANVRSLATFLNEQGIWADKDAQETIRVSHDMENDLKRSQRVKWVLHQSEIYFEPKLGGHARLVQLTGEEVEGLYKITAVHENYVLANKRNEDPETGVPLVSSENPFKILIPHIVVQYLKVGDDLHAGIRRVEGSGSWVITSFLGVEPKISAESIPHFSYVEDPTAENLAVAAAVPPNDADDAGAAPSNDDAYTKRAEALVKEQTPSDGFDEGPFTEAWFTAREIDIASDEEIGWIWDEDDDEYSDPESDDVPSFHNSDEEK